MTEQKKAKAIFLEAIESIEPEGWETFLDGACDGDDALLRQVQRLLKSHQEKDSLFDRAKVTVDFPTKAAVEPLTQIGPYKIREQIGEGGMGIVYVAEQQSPVKRKVALKVIKPGMDSKEVVARFEAERQALAMMDHPGIAKVFDGGVTETGQPYFAMELINGIPITQYCDEQKLGIRERLDLFIDVCHAVQHAHQKGVIHRDIKPTNVLVTLHDGKPVPVVIDFGVAKATNQNLTDQTIYTRMQQVIGTTLYMSPEQAELSRFGVDTRSDIYSLGVLLYEMLAGTTPFDRERFKRAALDEVRRIIREEEPPKPSTRLSTLGENATRVSSLRRTDPQKLRHSLRGDLDWIVMMALEKDRNRRYETANGLAMDVTRYLEDEPILARPPSTWYRMQKFYSRNKALTTTSLLIILALATGLAAAMWGLNEAKQATKSVKKERDEKQELADDLLDTETRLREKLDDNKDRLYRADMREALIRWREGDLPSLRELVGKHEGSALRKWEWYFLNTTLNTGPKIRNFGRLNGSRIRISPDDRYLLVTHPHRKLFTIFDTQREMVRGVVGGGLNEGWQRSFAEFSADGERVLFSPHDKRSLKIFHLRDFSTNQSQESVIYAPKTDQIHYARFVDKSPNLVVFVEGNWVKLLDLKTQKEPIPIAEFPEKNLSFLYSQIQYWERGDKYLINAGHSIFEFDLNSGKTRRFKGAHEGGIWDFVIIQESDRMLSCSFDRTIRIWDLNDLEQPSGLLGTFDEQVRSIAFDPNKNILAAGTRHRRIHRWKYEPATGEFGRLPTINGFAGVAGMEFDSEGNLYFLSQDYCISKLDKACDYGPRQYHNPGKLRDLCFSNNSDYLLATQANELLEFKRSTDGLGLLSPNKIKLDFSPAYIAPLDGNDRWLIVERNTSRIHTYSNSQQKVLLNPVDLDLEGGISCLQINRETDHVAVGTTDGTVWIGDTKLKKVLCRKFHDCPVTNVAWSESLNRLVSSSYRGEVKFCQLSLKPEPAQNIEAFKGPVTNLQVLNSRIFVGLHFGDTLERKIIELDFDGNQVNHSEPFIFHAAGFAAIGDGETIVGIGQDRSFRFMDSDTLATRASFYVDEIYNQIVISPDTTMIATTTREGSLLLYEAEFASDERNDP